MIVFFIKQRKPVSQESLIHFDENISADKYTVFRDLILLAQIYWHVFKSTQQNIRLYGRIGGEKISTLIVTV